MAQAWTDHVVATVPSIFQVNARNGHNRDLGTQVPAGWSNGVSENCGATSANTPEEIVDGWMRYTDGHREALLDPKFNTVGVGTSNFFAPPIAYVCIDLTRY